MKMLTEEELHVLLEKAYKHGFNDGLYPERSGQCLEHQPQEVNDAVDLMGFGIAEKLLEKL